jgi:stage II sporulation protein D
VQPAAPGSREPRGEPAVRVGLAWDLDSLTITPTKPVELDCGRIDVYFTDKRAERLSAPFTIRVDGDGTHVYSGAGPGGMVTSLAPGDTLRVLDREHGPFSEPLAIWNGKRWRGSFRVFLNPRGKLTLVDYLPLETYLLGVVPGEIGGLTKELIEAGRAQAIAARSYTLFYRGRRASEGFDLYGSVEDQVYGPVESERPLATECVNDTRGEVALHDDQPLRANYCSTCGGISAEVWEAWPAAVLPYLESERDRGSNGDFCAASPQYRWRERWSAAEFVANVERFGARQGLALPADSLGDLVDVRVAARSVSGRVWRLLVRTTAGDVSIPAYSVRQVLRRGGQPNAILRSNLFKIDVRRDPATARALEVVASGAGAGHGVGLCQTGALGMARAGEEAKQILEHYYPRSQLRRLY